MKKILLLLSLVSFGQINAQTWVTIPDANFVTWLQTNIPSAMHGDSMNTSSPLVTNRTSITVFNIAISDLNGIQYFTSLRYLNCSQNNSNVNLPTLPNTLDTLKCNTNVFTNLPALPNTLLYLDCGSNYLTNISTLPSSIKYLDCSNNQLTTIPSLPNSLTHLDIESNNLTNISALPSALIFFNCGQNQYMTSLPSLPATLIYFGCYMNNFISLPSLPSSLITLECQMNHITSLPILPNSLQSLLCQNNNINCFPIFPHSITNLAIDPNPYNCLPNYIPALGSDTVTYPLCATGNSYGCPVANSIEQFESNIQVAVYPNPTSDQFYIETNATDKLNVDLFDVNGRHVFSASVSDKSNISAATLDNGIYTLAIKTADRVINKKLIILR